MAWYAHTVFSSRLIITIFQEPRSRVAKVSSRPGWRHQLEALDPVTPTRTNVSQPIVDCTTRGGKIDSGWNESLVLPHSIGDSLPQSATTTARRSRKIYGSVNSVNMNGYLARLLEHSYVITRLKIASTDKRKLTERGSSKKLSRKAGRQRSRART